MVRRPHQCQSRVRARLFTRTCAFLPPGRAASFRPGGYYANLNDLKPDFTIENPRSRRAQPQPAKSDVDTAQATTKSTRTTADSVLEHASQSNPS